MRFNLPYGKKNISLDVSDKNIVPIVFKDSQDELKPDEDSIISIALDNPISLARLSSLAYRKNHVCILVSDITRPCPSYKFLPSIIHELKEAEVGEIEIVFGLGIHRNHTDEEKIKLAGEMAAKNCKLTDSDISRCKFIGSTSHNTPVEVFEDVLKSDFIIATGNIEYHYFSGYSGGSKALMPGACSKNSISANHSMMLEDSAAAGEFFNNPVRCDIEEAGKLAGIDFIFNVILDDYKHVIGAVCGKNNEAYLEGIKLYDSIYEISVKEKADIVITSPGGYPKDINLYQAQKALDNVKNIVKDNGTVILVAQCTEGFGESVFEEWMADVKNYDMLHKRIKREFILGGHKAVAVSKLLTKARIYSYVDDKDKYFKSGFEITDNIQEFIDKEVKKNNQIKIAVVPNGRFVKFRY